VTATAISTPSPSKRKNQTKFLPSKYKESLDRPKWQYIRRENYSMVCPLSNVHDVHYVHGRLVGIGESTSLVVVFSFPPVWVSLAHGDSGLMISPYSSTLKGAVLKIRKIVPRLDFSSRAISVRCLLAAYSQHDSKVSRRNPVWICFGRLLSPRFRDRPADKLEKLSMRPLRHSPPAF